MSSRPRSEHGAGDTSPPKHTSEGLRRLTDEELRVATEIRNAAEDIFKELGIAEGNLRIEPDPRPRKGMRVVVSKAIRESRVKTVDPQSNSSGEWTAYSRMLQDEITKRISSPVVFTSIVYAPDVRTHTEQERFIDTPPPSRVRMHTVPQKEVLSKIKSDDARLRDSLVTNYGAHILNIEYPRFKKILRSIKQGTEAGLGSLSPALKEKVQLLAHRLDEALNQRMATARSEAASLNFILQSKEVDPLNRVLKLKEGVSITADKKSKVDEDIAVLRTRVLKGVSQDQLDRIWKKEGDRYTLTASLSTLNPDLPKYAANENTYWAIQRLAPLALPEGQQLPGVDEYALGLMGRSDFVSILASALEGKGSIPVSIEGAKKAKTKNIEVLPLLTRAFGIELPESTEEVSKQLAELKEEVGTTRESAAAAETPAQEALRINRERLEAIQNGGLPVLRHQLSERERDPEHIVPVLEQSSRFVLVREFRLMLTQIEEAGREVELLGSAVTKGAFDKLHQTLGAEVNDLLRRAEALPEPKTLIVELDDTPEDGVKKRKPRATKVGKSKPKKVKQGTAHKEAFALFRNEQLVERANELYIEMIENIITYEMSYEEASREFVAFTNANLEGMGKEEERAAILQEIELLREFSPDSLAVTGVPRLGLLLQKLNEWQEKRRPALLKAWQLSLGYVMIMTLSTAIKVKLEEYCHIPVDSAAAEAAAVMGGAVFAGIDIVGTKAMLSQLQHGMKEKPLQATAVTAGFATGASIIAFILAGFLQHMEASSAGAGQKVKGLEQGSTTVHAQREAAGENTERATQSYSAAMDAFSRAVVAVEEQRTAELPSLLHTLSEAGFPEYASHGLGSSAGEGFGPNARRKRYALTGQIGDLDPEFSGSQQSSDAEIDRIRALRTRAGLREGETYGDAVKRTIDEFIAENPYGSLDSVLQEIDSAAQNLREQDTFLNAVTAMLLHKQLITDTGLDLLADDAREAGSDASHKLEELANRLTALETGMRAVVAAADPSISIPSFDREVLAVDFTELENLHFAASSGEGSILPVVSMDAARIIAAYEARKRFPNEADAAQRAAYQHEVEQRNIAVTFSRALVIELGAFFAGLGILYGLGGRRRHIRAVEDIPVLEERLSNISKEITVFLNALRRRYVPGTPEIPEHMIARAIAETTASRQRSLRLPNNRTTQGAVGHLLYDEFFGMLVTEEMGEASAARLTVSQLGKLSPQSFSAALDIAEQVLPGIGRLARGESVQASFPDTVVENHLARRLDYFEGHRAALAEARASYIRTLEERQPNVIRALENLDPWKATELPDAVADAVQNLAAYDRALQDARVDNERSAADLGERLGMRTPGSYVTIPTEWTRHEAPPRLSVEANMLSYARNDVENRLEGIQAPAVLQEYQRILTGVSVDVTNLNESYGTNYSLSLDSRLYQGRDMHPAITLVIEPRTLQGGKSFTFTRELSPSDTAQNVSQELRSFVENNIAFEHNLLQHLEREVQTLRKDHPGHTIDFDYSRLFGDSSERISHIRVQNAAGKTLLDTRATVEGNVFEEASSSRDRGRLANQVATVISSRLGSYVERAVQQDALVSGVVRAFAADFNRQYPNAYTLSIDYTPDTKGENHTAFSCQIASATGQSLVQNSFTLEDPTEETITAQLRNVVRTQFEQGVVRADVEKRLRDEFGTMLEARERPIPSALPLVSNGELRSSPEQALNDIFGSRLDQHRKTEAQKIFDSFGQNRDYATARESLARLAEQISNERFLNTLFPDREGVREALRTVSENAPYKNGYTISLVFPTSRRTDTNSFEPYISAVRPGGFMRRAQEQRINLSEVNDETLAAFSENPGGAKSSQRAA